jgi:putative sigma-54 modulation protein
VVSIGLQKEGKKTMTVGAQTIIEGRKIEITPAIKEYAELKLDKVHKHFDSIIQNHDIKVLLTVTSAKTDNQKAEVTINLKGGHVIRCESSQSILYAAIDLVVDKIETQLRKYKTKIYSKIHNGKSLKQYGLSEDLDSNPVPNDILEQISSYKTPKIIKVKRFEMKPLEPEQAVEMLDDCGHPFYMFLNVFSNKIACVYKREDGGFGLIEPEFLRASL